MTGKHQTINKNSIIKVKGLKKTYRSRGKGGKLNIVEAVRGIDLQIHENEVFGLLGPNGAGKTTAMRMLATLITPTDGSAVIAGQKLEASPGTIRQKIGYVSQSGGMEGFATGRENVVLQGELYGLSKSAAKKRADELIDHLGLSEFSGRKAETYSGGQKRIFDLAVGIVHHPDILFLDEPTTGLDPQARATVWDQINYLQDEGTTIFITTHYLEEADMLCDRIAIMDHGKVIKRGTPEALKQEFSGNVVELELPASAIEQSEKLLKGEPFIENIEKSNSGLFVFVNNGESGLPSVIRKFDGAGIHIQSLEFSEPTLDDVFLELTGRSLRTGEETKREVSD